MGKTKEAELAASRNEQIMVGLWEKINKAGPVPADHPKLGSCWIWNGRTSKTHGYAVDYAGGHLPLKIARIVYYSQKGATPDDLEIDHVCNNRLCVNPDHVEWVSHRENMRRRKARGLRREVVRTFCDEVLEWWNRADQSQSTPKFVDTAKRLKGMFS
jgi:hypothetical protein